ncbi:MAG: heavy metal translocating P-type ATPase, partial [Lachnospiraceae bacterium]|nr:heavy metal translocating P-type ATPase [Lachnospiraceae bacterium]
MTKKLKKKIIRVGIGFVLFAAGILLSRFVNEWVGLGFYIAAYITVGADVLKNAAVNIAHGHVFDENFLMIIATLGAVVCKEYIEAVAVMLFYQVGECFQSYAVNKSRK